MSKHTPGPWYRQQDNDDPSFLIIRNDEGSKVATLHDPLADELAHAEELVANAALIAAAPDLLQAAQNLLAYLPESGDPFQDKLEAALVAAIAKAEGNA